jgi:hypothetical protein
VVLHTWIFFFWLETQKKRWVYALNPPFFEVGEKWFCKLGFWGGLQPEKNPSLQSHISRTTFLEKWSQIKRLTVLFGGVSETTQLLTIYKAGKCKLATLWKPRLNRTEDQYTRSTILGPRESNFDEEIPTFVEIIFLNQGLCQTINFFTRGL